MDDFDLIHLVLLCHTGILLIVYWALRGIEKKIDWLESSLRPLETTWQEASLVSEMFILRDQLHEILAEMNIEPRTPLSSTEDRYQKQCLELARFLEEAKRKRQAQSDPLDR